MSITIGGMMRVSVISYSFFPMTRTGIMDTFGYLETVRYRYDLRAADLWNWTMDSIDDDYVQAVRRGLIERELALANFSLDGCHVWEKDPGARKFNHRNALANLRAAEIMGAQTVRIDTGGPADVSHYTNQQFDHIVMRYREYAQRAYDNGYRVGPENHWGPERFPQELQRLSEAVDHPGFGILLHAGLWDVDADQGDRMLASWVMHTHLTESLTDDALAEVIATLDAAGYEGGWTAEVEKGATYVSAGLLIARIQRVLESRRLGDQRTLT